MTAKITAKFETMDNRTIFKGYDVVVDNEIVVSFYSEFDCIVYVMDNENLRLA